MKAVEAALITVAVMLPLLAGAIHFQLLPAVSW